MERLKTGSLSAAKSIYLFTFLFLILLPSTVKSLECSPDNWCMVNPRVIHHFWDLWAAPDGKAFAVGYEGAIMQWDGSDWVEMDSGTMYGLNGVWGSSSSDVWVVGGSGTIIHWDGSAWSAVPSGTTQTLYGVWGITPSDIYAVGRSGTIIHWDGIEWSAVTLGVSFDLETVWASSGSDVWAGGESQDMLHWNGSEWNTVPTPTYSSYNDLHGSSADDVWAIGYEGVFHWDGIEWALSLDSASGPFDAVWCGSPDNVWVSDTYGCLHHWDGVEWTAVHTGNVESLYGISGTATDNIWAGGYFSTILHYDGFKWSFSSLGFSTPLEDLWGTSDNDIFAVGRAGLIIHWDGVEWTQMDSGTSVWLTAVWGFSSDDVWAAGPGEDNQVVLHWDGISWSKTEFSIFDMGNPTGIWGVSGNDLWVASDLNMNHYNGTDWSSYFPGADDIYGFSSDDIFSVDRTDKIYRWNGVEWQPMTGTTDNRALMGVWGPSPDDVFAVGDSGVILHWDGSAWTRMSSNATSWFRDVYGFGPDIVYAVGYEGVRRFNGSVWEEEDALSGPLYGVWGPSQDSVWTVSDRGVIQHWTPAVPRTPGVTASYLTYPFKIVVVWEDVARETGYNIWRADSPYGTYTLLGTAPADTNYWEDPVPCDSGYYYKVSAFNDLGESDLSNYRQGRTSACPPDTPTDLQASDGTYGTDILITWTDISGETGYRIWSAPSADGPWVKIGQVVADVTSWVDPLTCGVTAYYRVTAYDSNGDSLPSNTDAGSTVVCPPDTPGGVSASDGTIAGTIRVTWDDVSWEDGYRVLRSSSAGGPFTEIGTTGADATVFDDSPPCYGPSYYYRVTSFNSQGESDPSAPDAGSAVPENRAPEAVAGGPYMVVSGEGVVLDGSGSSDPDSGCGDSIISWEWDLTGDGTSDASGESAAVTWPEVQALICGGTCVDGQDYNVTLKVADSAGAFSQDTAIINITFLLFEDDFSDGTIVGDPDWEEVSGRWRVNTALRMVSGRYTINRALVQGELRLDSFDYGRLETSVRLTRKFARKANAALIFDFQDRNNYRFAKIWKKRHRSRVVIGQAGDPAAAGEEPGVKVSKALPLKFRTWYRLTVDLGEDGSARVFLDDGTEPAASFTFDNRAPGRVGFLASKAKVFFDDAAFYDAGILQP